MDSAPAHVTRANVPTRPAGGRRSLTYPSPKRQAARAHGPGRGKAEKGPASALRDDEVRSAVRGVCRFVLVRVEGLLFTDRGDRHAGRVDAELDHVVKRRLGALLDRKSTSLNSSHLGISY